MNLKNNLFARARALLVAPFIPLRRCDALIQKRATRAIKVRSHFRDEEERVGHYYDCYFDCDVKKKATWRGTIVKKLKK
jgi:hypothetical protein